MGWVGDLLDAGTDIVKDIGGDIIDTVEDAVDDTIDFTKDVVNQTIDVIADASKFTFDVVWRYSGNEWLDKKITGGLITNSVHGIVDNVANFNHGLVNGDWTEIRDSGLGIVTTAVAVVAIVIGAVTGNAFLIASGIIMLDAQYNQGQTLGKVIEYTGDIETALFNTHYIEEYAVEIQILITVAATIYAGYMTAPVIGEYTGISTLAAEWATELNVLEAGYGGYQTYMAIQRIKDSQDYWEAQLREAEEYYRKLIAQAQAAKEQWFGMMTDFDLINRIQAGGDMFMMGAGHEMFSITSVAEPRFALGLIDKSDREMDKLINNRYFAESAGSDGFRVN